MARDKKVEAFLKKLGVKYEYQPKFKITDIDIEASRRNQVRTGAHVNDEQVLVYGIAMDSGEDFPPIVVHRLNPKNKAIVDDGNHRLKAITDVLELKHVEAYVVTEATELQILRLQFKANQTNGLALSMEDRVRHALILVAHGATQKDAAADIGIPVSRVQIALRQQETENRLTAMGVKRIDKLGPTHLNRLGNIKNDDVLRDMATTVIRHRIPVSDVDKFVTKLNKERTVEGQKKLINELGDSFVQDEKVRGGPDSPVKRIPAVVSGLRRTTASILRVTDAELAGVPKELRKDLLVRVQDASVRLQEIAKKLR